MNRKYGFLWGMTTIASVIFFTGVTGSLSCGRDPESSAVSDDAGNVDAGEEDDGTSGKTPLPPPDAATVHCTLDNGSDPVSFCLQKLVLRAQHEAAFDNTIGIAQSWDSKTFAVDKDAKNQPLH